MKTFLAFLLSCLTLSAATTYPVLTDSTNRLFPGGVTNVFFLNSNVVATGSFRATGAVTLTNSGNVFAGDGSGLTGINGGVPYTNGSATNLSVHSSGTTNRPLRIFATNGVAEIYVNKDGTLCITNSSVEANGFLQFNSPYGYYDNEEMISFTSAGPVRYGWGIGTGGAARFNQNGNFWMAGGATARLNGVSPQSYVVFRSDSKIGWLTGTSMSETADTLLWRDSAGVVATTNFSATGSLKVGGGASVTKILSATATLNFDLTALTVEDLTVTVTGAADGDVVTLGVPNGSVTTSVQYSAWVSAADTVTVRARTSAIGENPASGTFRATVIKH